MAFFDEYLGHEMIEESDMDEAVNSDNTQEEEVGFDI